MTIARFATIFIIRVFGTHLWRSLCVLRLFTFFRNVVFELVHAFACSRDWSFPLFIIVLLVCQLPFGSSFSSGTFYFSWFAFIMRTLTSLFTNAFWQRCYKIETSPFLHTLVVCFFFLLSLIAFPFCSQIFLRKVFRKKPKLFRTHICRASLQGFRRLFCQQGLRPRQICIIGRSGNGWTLL